MPCSLGIVDVSLFGSSVNFSVNCNLTLIFGIHVTLDAGVLIAYVLCRLCSWNLYQDDEVITIEIIIIIIIAIHHIQ